MQSEGERNISYTRKNVEPYSWVANYSDYLYNYAISRINDEELARDLVQETFLAALEGLKKFEKKSSERTWLTAILKYKIIDVYRKRASGFVKNGGPEPEEQEQTGFFDTDNGHWNEVHQPREFTRAPDDHLVAKEFNAILQQCVQKLPSLWLAVFTLKHLDELPAATICKALKLTSSNFWVIIHRAKINLRACLEKNWI